MECQGQTFEPFDSYTAFIYKFNPDGELLHVSRIGAVVGDFTPFNLECDSNGDIYILGQPNGVSQININGNIVSAVGNTNQLIKINSNGVFAWKIDTGFASNGEGVMLQYNNGFVYYQSGALSINRISTEGVIPASPLTAVYYNSTVASSGPNFKGSGVFSNGDLLFAAYSYGDVAFDIGNTETADTLFNIGNAALTAPFLLMRVTPDLQVTWMTYLSNGRDPDNKFIPVAIDMNDDVFACVQVNSEMTVGTDVISNTENVFVGIGSLVKLDENGQGVWARTLDNNEVALGWSITAAQDVPGVWIGGGYSFTPDFDGFPMPTSSNSFPFLAKCSTDGLYTNVFIPTDFNQTDVLSLKPTMNGRYIAGGKLNSINAPSFSCVEIDPAKGFYIGAFSEQPEGVPQPTLSQIDNVLTVSPPFDGEIVWFLNGVEIPGANGQTFTATESGNYSVTYTSTTGCPSSETSDEFFAEIVSVNELANLAWSIYPNPTAGELFVRKSNVPSVSWRLEICNVHGQIVEQSVCTGELCSIDLSNLPSGWYVVRISDAKEFASYVLQKH
jgi:hypothetical protein